MDATIVIPTKNGGKLLDRVLSRVFRQETEYEFEVICVDSGSTDDTLSIIEKYPCRLYQIPPEEFGHGKTRNFGASKGTGEYILFLTQDALPASKKWLQNFIDAMKIDPEIVGGFGIHYPYPNCNIFDKQGLKAHFEQFGDTNTIFCIDDSNRERYYEEEAYRHRLTFFSDNNSCVRRDIFSKYPYEDVNFAEDQIWARQMIEMGFKKVYCPFAPVYHSHNFPPKVFFERQYDEFKGIYEIHQYKITDHAWKVPLLCGRQVLNDLRYIRTLPMSRTRKLKALGTSVSRSFGRFVGGYLGGCYHSFPHCIQVALDRTISQQYRQRKE